MDYKKKYLKYKLKYLIAKKLYGGMDIDDISLQEQFFQAAKNGNYEIVKSLMFEGVDVNAKDSDGWTALMYAAQQGHVEIVNLLLKKGADISLKNNDGNTADELAYDHKFEQALLSQFINPDLLLNDFQDVVAPVAPVEVPEDVAPEDVVPEDVVPGDVVPGDVAPGDVVPGDVAPGNVVGLWTDDEKSDTTLSGSDNE